MSHELVQQGDWAGYVGREPMWAGLGQVFPDGLSYTQAMESAKLAGWLVQAVPLSDVTKMAVNDDVEMQAITRRNPLTMEREVFTTMGGKYTAVQNEEAFRVAEILTEEDGFEIVTAGQIRGGRQVWMLLESEKGFIIDPDGANDAIRAYLALRTSHDGTTTVQAVPTLVRIQCANTWDATSAEGRKAAYSIRHTDGVHDALVDAQAALIAANSYTERFAVRASQWAETPLRTNNDLREFVRVFQPRPEDEGRAQTGWDNRFEAIVEVWGSETNETIQNTLWGGVNAVSEWSDWFATVSGEEKDPARRLSQQMGLLGGSGWSDKKALVTAADTFMEKVNA